MCSRYFLDDDGNIIAYTFQVPVHDRILKRFNIAPTQQAPVVRAASNGGREIAMLRWGLVPFWAKDLKIGTKMINARSEGIDTKPAFRDALKERRCIVPATGFFEWQGEPGRNSPSPSRCPTQRPSSPSPDCGSAGSCPKASRWKPSPSSPPMPTSRWRASTTACR
jgi:putative SOS response-associated peptidase YedK